MTDAELSIVDQIKTTIHIGSAEKRLATARQVTDLFLSSAGSFNHEQIELFGDLLERLIKTIELRAVADVSARIALAEMSVQLAPIAQAPPSVVRRLAMNDEIAVAGPVLTESARLSTEDLVEIAETNSEQHLLAISGRWWLKEVITDALLARRYPTVSRRIVSNPGARVSGAGFAANASSSTVAQCDGSGPITAIVPCATAHFRGNPQCHRDRRRGCRSRNVQRSRLYRGQAFGGAAQDQRRT